MNRSYRSKELDRAKQLKTIADIQKEFTPEKRWCATHPLGFWGKDQWGNWYTQCFTGHSMNEECIIGK